MNLGMIVGRSGHGGDVCHKKIQNVGKIWRASDLNVMMMEMFLSMLVKMKESLLASEEALVTFLAGRSPETADRGSRPKYLHVMSAFSKSIELHSLV